MPAVRFDAVTFDVDGTLYDFRELAKVFGVKALLRRRFFTAYMEAREEVRGAGEVGDVRQAQSEGVDVPAELIEKLEVFAAGETP